MIQFTLGPRWVLRHPKAPGKVCVLTEEEYRVFPIPDGSSAEKLMFEAPKEFIKAAKPRGAA